MNRLQLRTLVLNFVDDQNAGYFSESFVNTSLNNSVQEVAKRLIKAGENYYLKCSQTTLVVNQKDYVFPEDFRKLNRLEIVMSGSVPNETVNTLIPMTLNQQDLVPGGVGTPQFYFIKKNRVVIVSAPDTARVMRLYYSYVPSDMSLDSDIPDVPPIYHELIALYTAQDCFLRDGRSSELLVKKIAEFESMMDSDADDRKQDQPRQVIEMGSGEYSGMMW